MPKAEPTPPPFPATYAEVRAAVGLARQTFWKAAYGMSSDMLLQEPGEWSEQSLRVADANYHRSLMDLAMSALEEFVKGAEKHKQAAEAADRTHRRVAIGLLVATTFYAVAAIWQATHPTVVTVPVVPIQVSK